MHIQDSSTALQQALRLRRFAFASLTYVLGLALLALAAAFGMMDMERLIVVAAVFVAINGGFLLIFRLGWNLRFADPSLTQAQVVGAAGSVAMILVLGEQLHMVAVPFYSTLFVFAMLRLRPREMVLAEGIVLLTYFIAFALRIQLYGERLDMRVEAIHAILMVGCTAWFAVAANFISQLRTRLRESVQTIEHLASRDALTNTWNRRHLDTLLAAELARKQRWGGALCVALVDLDHFKSINDRFGHLVGDAVLNRVAHAMQAQLRSTDQLGRFGGEEFLILLPGAELDDARTCVERLLLGVSSLNVLPDEQGRVTVSIGLAQCQSGETSDALLFRVDQAMYRAKHDGRNRVRVSPPPAMAAAPAPAPVPMAVQA
ncbi:MAG: GGDEF domain-containing protein [Rubrivivax sp.]|nr:GGDEF domain-containing protein [Rubrivivax sp.]